MKKIKGYLLFGVWFLSVLFLFKHRLSIEREKVTGLIGTYYSDLDGTKVYRGRLDGAVLFDWSHEKPFSGMPNDHYSVRWTVSVPRA
jgi:hypothetical protein